MLKNKEVHKTFSTLYNATNNYASGIISKRRFAGVFNLHTGKFISAVSNALPGTVAIYYLGEWIDDGWEW